MTVRETGSPVSITNVEISVVDGDLVVFKLGKAIVDLRAQVGVDVFGLELAEARSVEGPCSPVADYFVGQLITI